MVGVDDDERGRAPDAEPEDGPLVARDLEDPGLVRHQDCRPVQPPGRLPAVAHVDGQLGLDHVAGVAVVSVTVAQAQPAQSGRDEV